MTHDLTTLADKRDALLLAEIAAWLHMLGKFHENFLKGQHDLDIQIPPDLTANFTHLDQLLRDPSWTGATWNGFSISELQAASLSVFHFMKEHRNRNVAEGLLKLMWDAHGRGSGIEKGVLNRFAPGQATTVYPSTAFGTETHAIDLNNLQNERSELYNFLQTNLELLKNSLGSSAFNWQNFRHNFISNIEEYFRRTVAETRRPLSDVTLFDQTSASVAFLKAALAQNLLAGWKEPVTNTIADKYHWRLLRVGLDGLAFWADSVRIGDLLARKELISSALDKVQKAIEEDYPLGLQVYRDENGSVFIVPDVDDLLKATVKSGSSLCEHLQEIAKRQFKGEACWKLDPRDLSDRTRNTLKFGKFATSQLDKITANSQSIKPYWNIKKKQDICPVCNLRPIGSSEKALRLKVCDLCCDRRTNRAKVWTENLPTTIWIDEVADTNGRLALIVGRFELESWLTGEAFNTIVAFNPENHSLIDEKRDNKSYAFKYRQLSTEIEATIKSNQFTKKAPLLGDLILKDDRGGSFGQFYDLQVTDTDLGKGKTVKESSLLALAMLRQNPSFARLRRVWETTQKFWQEVIADVPDTQLPKVKGRLIINIRESEITRLKLVNFGNYDLVIRNVKLSVLRWDDRLITTDNLRYVAKQLHAFSDSREDENTNLYSDCERTANFIRSQLLNQQISIEEPTGYGSPNRLHGQLEINSDDITFDSTQYSPVIQILTEPSTFIALVPANNINSLESLNIIRTIKTKYDREMGKVRNRLPLHLGVVYFQRRTPLRSALDAGRQMLNYKSPNDKQLWEVQSTTTGQLPAEKQELANGTKQFDETITLQLTQDSRAITWHVPAKMGDGDKTKIGDGTTDVWYPYVFLETNGDDSKVNGRLRTIKSQRPGETTPCWLVHAADLQEGDRIYFTPSTFDFEFLDSTARRFEIYYDENGRRPRQTRPFYLEDLDRFDILWKILKNLEKSQRHQIIYTIEATREMWFRQNESGLLLNDEGKPPEEDKVFRRFVADTLANATWTKEKTDWWQSLKDWRRKLNEVCEISLDTWVKGELTVAKQLIDAGVRGELADLADLYMGILKEREDDSNGNL